MSDDKSDLYPLIEKWKIQKYKEKEEHPEVTIDHVLENTLDEGMWTCLLSPGYLKCGPWISSWGGPGKLVRKAETRAVPQARGIRTCSRSGAKMHGSVFASVSWWCRSSEERESHADRNGCGLLADVRTEVKSVGFVGLVHTERRGTMHGVAVKIGFWKVVGFSGETEARGGLL